MNNKKKEWIFIEIETKTQSSLIIPAFTLLHLNNNGEIDWSISERELKKLMNMTPRFYSFGENGLIQTAIQLTTKK